MTESATYRILDAAANRATEGLRVVEDFARFVLDDAHLTGLVKQLRHDLATACSALPWSDRLAARETQHDVGTTITTAAELSRDTPHDVCVASLQRVKQSFRSLEEYGKLLDAGFATLIETARYQLYTLERALGITHECRLRLREVRLCVLIDGCDTLKAFERLVTQLLEVGVPMIQLREKKLPDAEFIDRAKKLLKLAKPRDTLAIINDRPDIAAAVGADGVHLGQDDMSVKDARALVGPRRLIGLSTHSIQQARTAVLDGANYLGAGPTFPSTTKSFDHFPGLDYLAQVAAEIGLPTYAIGGITSENLPQVLATNIPNIAVSNAVTNTDDPQEVVKQLLSQLHPADG